MDAFKSADVQVGTELHGHTVAFSLSEALTASVIETVEERGFSAGLPALDWALVRYPESVIIEGRPRRPADAASCTQWANLLQMTRYEAEPGVRREAWFFNDEFWCLEIVSTVRSSGSSDASAS